MLQKADDFYPVSRPEISSDTIDELLSVINSGWLATGPKTQQFEKDLSDYFGGRTALAITSNTVGLYTALRAIGVGQGGKVITPPLTFVAAANAIELCGASPVFVDVDIDTFNLDLDKLSEINDPSIKAVIPVHYAGLPVDMDKLTEIAKEKRWRIIEDAAHAMGAYYKGKSIGSFGDIQVFSFHPIKNMTTGEGGCISVSRDDKDFIKFVELFRFHGIDRSIWDRFSKNGKSSYDVVMPGLKFNMSDIQAVIGVHQLSELEEMNAQRRHLADRYRSAFANISVIKLQSIPDYEHVHSCHLFPIMLSDHETRDNLAEFLKEHNIGTTPYYYPIHLFSYYSEKYLHKVGDFPNSEYIGNRVLCIPLYPSLSEDNQDYVVDKILSFLMR